MRRNQIEEVITAIKRKRNHTLISIKQTLRDMISERECTKGMYFWNPSKSASGRRYNEKKRNIELMADLGVMEIKYRRNYSESCHYVYADDSIWSSSGDKLTIADLKKLISGIDEILQRRGIVDDEREQESA